ncbi:hypothetical protein GCM10022224_036040 [Nonomuraea antimicrobica]|uniref:Uncharacterized protein n=1 Tax=Nonomuraea antimicrobica TaxID=561173 RepID=A0ABP7BVH6_9ACTN
MPGAVAAATWPCAADAAPAGLAIASAVPVIASAAASRVMFIPVTPSLRWA